jgi:adenosylcobinamide-GDP ribazoletransferase
VVPVPAVDYQPNALARGVKYFPLVGALIGGAAALLNLVLVRRLPRLVTAFVVVTLLILITGCLHEDGLADAADGFGGGHTREKILLILRDSCIGSYGAVALCLSIVGRIILISSLPASHITAYLIAASVLCRWTVLPLSCFLPSAREGEGQGARIARLTSRWSLIFGTLFAFISAGLVLRWQALVPIAASLLVTYLSGRFYFKKIGGITGDCFGATMQLSEIAVYLCGVWGV